MATVLTVTALDGLFKEVYADKLKDLKLRGYTFQNDFKWLPANKGQGGTYHQPVILKHENGFTYSPSGKGAFTLRVPAAGGTDDATILGTQLLLRSRLDYESAARAAKGRNSFIDATRLLVQEMVSSRAKRLEIELLYGQVGLGTVSNTPGAAQEVIVTEDTWAPGIWAGMEGASVSFWSTNTERLGGIAIDTDVGHAGGEIESVNMDTRTLTIAAAFNVDESSEAIAAGDIIFFAGARASTGESGYTAGDDKCFLGLHGILTANDTPTVALFGITPDTSSLWQPTKHTIGGSSALTFSDVQRAVVKAIGKGLDSDLCLYLSPKTWADLIDAEEAKRRWQRPTGRFSVGAEGITFHSQNGTILIKASNYVKQSMGYMVSPVTYRRVGALDWTFNLPGTAEKSVRFFENLQDAAGYELRTYTHQALFTASPGHGVLLDDIAVT